MADNILAALNNMDTAVQALTAQISLTGATLRTGMAELSEAMRAFRPCDCPMGETLEPPAYTEGDPPPTGFSEYDPEISDRKCKLANMTYDDILAITVQLKELGVENAITLGIGSTTSIVNVVMGLLAAGPLGWGMSVLGAVTGVVAFFMTQAIDLDALIAILQNGIVHENSVNAIYNENTQENALDEFKTILSAAGATATHLAYIDALHVLNGLTIMFLIPDGEWGVRINNRLDGYPTTIECVTVYEHPWVLDYGSGDVTPDGSTRTISSENLGGSVNHVQIQILNAPFNHVNRYLEVVSVTGFTNYPSATNDIACSANYDSFIIIQDHNGPGTPPDLGEYTCSRLRATSQTPWSMEVRLWGDVQAACT